MKASLIVALGIMQLMEGIFPMFFPRQWREAFSRLVQLSDGQIRFLGMVVLLSGFVILALANLFF